MLLPQQKNISCSKRRLPGLKYREKQIMTILVEILQLFCKRFQLTETALLDIINSVINL